MTSVWRFKNLHGLNTEIFESPYFNTWRFKISVYRNTRIKKFMFQRFLNLHVLIHGDLKLCLHHGDFWISVLENGDKKYQKLNTNFQIVIQKTKFEENISTFHYIHWSLISSQHFILNLHVLYTEIFPLKAYNSAKKQLIEIF